MTVSGSAAACALCECEPWQGLICAPWNLARTHLGSMDPGKDWSVQRSVDPGKNWSGLHGPCQGLFLGFMDPGKDWSVLHGPWQGLICAAICGSWLDWSDEGAMDLGEDWLLNGSDRSVGHQSLNASLAANHCCAFWTCDWVFYFKY